MRRRDKKVVGIVLGFSVEVEKDVDKHKICEKSGWKRRRKYSTQACSQNFFDEGALFSL